MTDLQKQPHLVAKYNHFLHFMASFNTFYGGELKNPQNLLGLSTNGIVPL